MKNLTICIPTYNRLGMLKEFVNNIPEEYPVCISDNGNYVPDNSFNRDNVHIYHFDRVVSSGVNWNKAVSLVETDWFILPGDDDMIIPQMLPSVMNYIDKYSDSGMVIFGYDIINERAESRRGWCPQEELYFGKPDGFFYFQNNVPFRWPAIVINTAKSREINDFDLDFSITAGDSFYLQHLAIKNPIAIVPEVIGKYRVWGKNTTNSKLFSDEWFNDIKLWQDKIREICINEKIYNPSFKIIRDKIIIDNLIAALLSAKNVSIKDKLNFVVNVGIPYRAGIHNMARLLRVLIK